MKRKINLNREQISNQEIEQRKDFDSVLKKYRTFSKPFYKKSWFTGGMAAVAVGVFVSLLVLQKQSGKQGTGTNSEPSGSTAQAISVSSTGIHPPISGLNVPFQNYSIDAHNGGSFTHSTGSSISFDPDSFIDEQGKSVNGKVDVQYREFHDPADFFVSGIPMTFDSAGVRYQFASAGMIEIKASCNGQPVHLKQNKTATVNMVSEQAGDYNLYELDTLHNNWSCLGKNKGIAKNGTASDDLADGATKKNQTAQELKQIEQQNEVAVKQCKAEKEKQIEALPAVSSQPVKPVAAHKGKFSFNLDTNPAEFPELAVYKDVLFEVGDENTGFTPALYDITWEEALIKEGPRKNENYHLLLTKGSKKIDLIVYPVLEGKNFEAAQKLYQDKFVSYNKLIEKRRADEKRIEEEYAAKLTLLKKQQEEAELRAKQREKELFVQMNTEEQVMRVFAINHFGVYNCDNPRAYPTGQKCVVNFTNDKKAKLMVYNVYLVEKGSNSLFTYNHNPVTDFSFNPASANIIWTVDNGEMYYYLPADFKKITAQDAMQELPLHKAPKFNDLDEMKTFFAL